MRLQQVPDGPAQTFELFGQVDNVETEHMRNDTSTNVHLETTNDVQVSNFINHEPEPGAAPEPPIKQNNQASNVPKVADQSSNSKSQGAIVLIQQNSRRTITNSSVSNHDHSLPSLASNNVSNPSFGANGFIHRPHQVSISQVSQMSQMSQMAGMNFGGYGNKYAQYAGYPYASQLSQSPASQPSPTPQITQLQLAQRVSESIPSGFLQLQQGVASASLSESQPANAVK